jgi:hypothetical protein
MIGNENKDKGHYHSQGNTAGAGVDRLHASPSNVRDDLRDNFHLVGKPPA